MHVCTDKFTLTTNSGLKVATSPWKIKKKKSSLHSALHRKQDKQICPLQSRILEKMFWRLTWHWQHTALNPDSDDLNFSVHAFLPTPAPSALSRPRVRIATTWRAGAAGIPKYRRFAATRLPSAPAAGRPRVPEAGRPRFPSPRSRGGVPTVLWTLAFKNCRKVSLHKWRGWGRRFGPASPCPRPLGAGRPAQATLREIAVNCRERGRATKATKTPRQVPRAVGWSLPFSP